MSQTNMITIFKNIKETSTPFYTTVEKVLERIKNGKSAELCRLIRKSATKAERNELKKDLPSICFSGKFKKREDSALIEHSGIICLDFDDYGTNKDMLQDKEKISKDKYVYSVFVSPSGKGLKVLVKIPADVENHKNYFNALKDHFDNPHFDTTSKNVSRVCYESYDPNIYINTNSSVWETVSEPEYKEVNKNQGRPTIPITDENKVLDILVKWWTKKFPMVEGQRNNNGYILAIAMNEFGINKSLAERVLLSYETSDFTASEIKTMINSAYKNTAAFGSKYYEDEDKVNTTKAKIRRGVPKEEVKDSLREEGIDRETIDSVIKNIEEDGADHIFWKKSDKGVVKIDHLMFKHFLEDNGFYKYYPEGGKNYVFVKVTNNLVDHTTEAEIKDFVLSHLLERDDVDVYNYFAGATKLFKEDFLSLLDTIDLLFIEDKKDSAYLYYLNCAVKVTQKEIVPIDYVDLGGYVWKDHVIDRNFKVTKSASKCTYKKFIENICAKDDNRIKSMESTIGFLLHAHKNLSFCPAVILNDEVISDTPEGGTGKGLFMNALSQMKKIVTIDGKSFTFERSFAYQLVSADTQILVFDDVRKHFDFERLFSVVTEGLTLEKKNKDAIKIPFHKSPKIAITTNYAIKGTGNSFARRKWELELHQYYRKDYTPLDEFGKLMFGDWNDEEWLSFDNYMIGCLKSYLKTGLVKSDFVNLKIRHLSASTSHDFIEWVGLVGDVAPVSSGYDMSNIEFLKEGKKVHKKSLYDDFVSEYPDYGPRAKMTVSLKRFYTWINDYCKFLTGYPPEEGRDEVGKWVKTRNKHNFEKQNKLL